MASSASLFCACEEEAPSDQKAAAPTPEVTQAAQLAAATVAAPEPKEPEEVARPTTISTELTDELRTSVEAAHSDAKGFLMGTELEEKLKKDPKNTAKAAALKSFDKLAKGKWVLFTGNLVNPTDAGFELGVTYTPLAPGDRIGISRQFFTVTFSNVEGYDSKSFKPGTMVAVLAKYNGDAVASPGYELVAEDKWK